MATTFKFKADGSGYARGLNQMRQQTQKFSGAVKGMMAGLAGAFSIRGVKTLLDEMDRIQKLSLRFGMSAAQIQKMGFAAEQSGASLEMVAKGMLQANRAAVEADAGLKSYQRAFEMLGINYQEFAKLDQEQQFLTIADAVKNATDQNKAMAASQVIMGRAAAELMPLLKQGSEGYRQLTDDLSTYSDTAVAKAAAINDAVNKMTTQIKTQIGSWLIEAVNAFKLLVVGATQAAMEVQDVYSGLFGAIGKALEGDLKGAAKQLGQTMQNYKGAGGRINEAIKDEALEQVQEGQRTSESMRRPQTALGGALGVGGGDDPDKLRQAEERIAEERQRQKEAEMDMENKIGQAMLERMVLEQELAELPKDSVAYKEKELEVVKAIGKEKELQKQLDEQAKKAAEEENKKRAEIANINAQIAQEQKDREEAGMTPEEIEQRRTSEAEQSIEELATLRKKALEDGKIDLDEEKEIASKRLEAEEAITAAMPEQREGADPAVITSALASIGAGGGTAMFSNDPILNENKRQTDLLAKISDALGGGDGTRGNPEI